MINAMVLSLRFELWRHRVVRETSNLWFVVSTKTEKMRKSVTSNSLFATENGGISERSRQLIFSKVQRSANDSGVVLLCLT